MKKVTFLLTVMLVTFELSGQKYFPFPTDTAQWNCLTIASMFPNSVDYINSQYKIRGDTVIHNVSYNKIYYTEDHWISDIYIGGLREDSSKQIYFYPYSKYLPNYCRTEFPSDTAEYLLYTFDSLTAGVTLPINTGATQIKADEIDSILLNGTYRKRYKIQQQNLFDYDYWIEGIGSTKDLFAPYSYEFEWTLYTLCYKDTLTYYINSPNGEDSCYYKPPVGITEITSDYTNIYPNPASRTINLETGTSIKKGTVTIYSIHGQKLFARSLKGSEAEIDISRLENGIYFLEVIGEEKIVLRFIKK